MDGKAHPVKAAALEKCRDVCWPEGMRSYLRSAAYIAEAQRDPAERPCVIRQL